ncbi:hypothetical protein BCR44DRAFT_407687, partial [Catenaria anguillulae PL171]
MYVRLLEDPIVRASRLTQVEWIDNCATVSLYLLSTLAASFSFQEHFRTSGTKKGRWLWTNRWRDRVVAVVACAISLSKRGPACSIWRQKGESSRLPSVSKSMYMQSRLLLGLGAGNRTEATQIGDCDAIHNPQHSFRERCLTSSSLQLMPSPKLPALVVAKVTGGSLEPEKRSEMQSGFASSGSTNLPGSTFNYHHSSAPNSNPSNNHHRAPGADAEKIVDGGSHHRCQ